MATRNDGLAEILVQLAGNAATLIERARASAALKAAQTVDGEAKEKAAAAATPTPDESDSKRDALQDIVVQQAMKIHLLEAEIATLRAGMAEMAAAGKKPATKAKRAKKAAAPPGLNPPGLTG